MSPNLRRDVLMKMVRLFDLAAVCVIFIASLAISSASLSWPSLAEVLVMRIKLANLLLFVGYLALCSAVFLVCGLYREHRLFRWPQSLYEIFLAVTLLTGVPWLLRRPLALEFATDAFLLLFWLLMLCALILSHEIARWLLHLARLHGRSLRNVVVVIDGMDAVVLVNRIRQEVGLGYRVLRVINAGEVTEDGGPAGDR
jgi:FlaA1/EpsC-like NDP-sugar epimerase